MQIPAVRRSRNRIEAANKCTRAVSRTCAHSQYLQYNTGHFGYKFIDYEMNDLLDD